MVSKTWIAIMTCAAALLPAAGMAGRGGDGPGAPESNLAVTITVDEGDGSGDRSYRLVTRGDGSPTRLNTGWRVPIPTTTYSAGDGEGQPGKATSYTYQSVGLAAQLRAMRLDGDQVSIRGEIDVSAAKDSAKGAAGRGAPTIGTFEQDFDVLLEEGSVLELADVSNPQGGAISVRLRVDSLK